MHLLTTFPVFAFTQLSLLTAFVTSSEAENLEYINDDTIIIKATHKEQTMITETDEEWRSSDEYSEKLPKIVGGRMAELGEYPWMVSIQVRGQYHNCGGSVLDRYNVLTAAHCMGGVNEGNIGRIKMRFGITDLKSFNATTDVERSARSIAVHRWFSKRFLVNDIAIIHLSEPIEFSETIKPITPHPGTPMYTLGTTQADVAGWGRIRSGGPPSYDLLATTVRVHNWIACGVRFFIANQLYLIQSITSAMICADSFGKEGCQGDSGGALVLDPKGEPKQIGIVSWGIGCLLFPTVYTRVDNYLAWIEKNKYKDESNSEIEKSTEKNHEIENSTERNYEIEKSTKSNYEIGNSTEINYVIEKSTDSNYEIENSTESNYVIENSTER